MGWNYVTFPNSTVVPLKFGNRLVISFKKFKTKRFRLYAHLPFWIWARDIALPLLFGISSVRNFIPVRTRYCITCLFWNRQMQWTVIYLVVIACNIYRGLLQDCISPASSNWKGVMQSSPISEYHCAIFILASTGEGLFRWQMSWIHTVITKCVELNPVLTFCAKINTDWSVSLYLCLKFMNRA